MLERIYIFAWVICIASQVLFDLSSFKREKGLWTWVGLNSPPVSTKGHTLAGFCGGGAPQNGGTFGYKEGAPGNSGAVGGKPSRGGSFSWLPVLNTICLVGSLLGRTTIPYLRQSSFISLSRKKIWI